MAKSEKKSPKEASQTFHDIMKASVVPSRKFFKGFFDQNNLNEIVPYTPETPGETSSTFKIKPNTKQIEYIVVEAATEDHARHKILAKAKDILKDE